MAEYRVIGERPAPRLPELFARLSTTEVVLRLSQETDLHELEDRWPT